MGKFTPQAFAADAEPLCRERVINLSVKTQVHVCCAGVEHRTRQVGAR